MRSKIINDIKMNTINDYSLLTVLANMRSDLQLVDFKTYNEKDIVIQLIRLVKYMMNSEIYMCIKSN